GSTISVAVLSNDDGYGSGLRLSNGQSSLVVPGEGTWRVVGTNVTFEPLTSFRGNPAPVGYRWDTGSGQMKSATVTVGYVVSTADDADLDNIRGTSVTVSPLANDAGSLLASSVRIQSGTNWVTTRVVN